MKMPAMRQVAAASAGDGGGADTLRVMTYNVLAQCYVRSSFFPYCNSSALRWKNRSKKLEEVFASSLPVSPDVICLQECDQYDEFWAGMMKKLGYKGFFAKKTSKKPDGVAVFWKADKLEPKSHTLVSLDLPNGDEGDCDQDVLMRSSNRGSVGLVVHFQSVHSPLQFVLATTHLFWDPAQEDVKLLQTRRMLLSVEAFASVLDASVPIIFAGDFNSLPDSQVYRFITSEKHFLSAYAQYGSADSSATQGEPDFSNVNGITRTDDGKEQVSFVGTLDYIFYQSARLQPTALMELMPLEEATKEFALPSTFSPSDHLPLLCEFRFQPLSS